MIPVVGLVLVAYFYTHPGIWTTSAETFYVRIFGGASVLAVLAGTYRVYSRQTRYLLP